MEDEPLTANQLESLRIRTEHAFKACLSCQDPDKPHLVLGEGGSGGQMRHKTHGVTYGLSELSDEAEAAIRAFHEQVEACKREHKLNPGTIFMTKDHRPDDDRAQRSGHSIFQAVHLYYEQTKTFAWDGAIAAPILDELVGYIADSGPEMVMCSPLLGFKREGDKSLHIGNVTIRRLNQVERQRLTEHGLLGTRSPYQGYDPADWCLARSLSHQENADHKVNSKAPFNRTLIGLNLSREIPVRSMTTLTYHPKWRVYDILDGFTTTSHRMAEEFSESDDEDLLNQYLVPAYHGRWDRAKYLQAAGRRLLTAKERNDDRDTLVDYVTGLEALFMHEKQELTYRLRLRASRFCGATIEERRDLFAFVNEVYKVRSKLVHGDTATVTNEMKTKLHMLYSKAILLGLERASELEKEEEAQDFGRYLDELLLGAEG